jgi:hypothetical protein
MEIPMEVSVPNVPRRTNYVSEYFVLKSLYYGDIQTQVTSMSKVPMTFRFRATDERKSISATALDTAIELTGLGVFEWLDIASYLTRMKAP